MTLEETARWIIRSCEEMAANRDAPVITAIDAAEALRAAPAGCAEGGEEVEAR